jgi:high-affinity iron transporter
MTLNTARLARLRWFASIWVVLALACLGVHRLADAAPASREAQGQILVHMLDYVAVDYPAFVRDGQVLDASEYDEQREFAAQVIALLSQSAPAADRPALLEKARRLHNEIEQKADGGTVARLAIELRTDIIRSYGVIVVPAADTDLSRGATLFEAHCSTCHGHEGRGDGPAAQGMDPPPTNFHDAERMDALTLYGMYNTITLGVSGTPMRAFDELSDTDRWALAFFVGNLRFDADAVARGEHLWSDGLGRTQLGSLRKLVTTPLTETRNVGGEQLASVQIYLSHHPEVLRTAADSPLQVTRQKLKAALDVYRTGDRERAKHEAIAAYLEGFELIEASLDTVDAPLRMEIERQMMALRSMIGSGQPVERIEEQVRHIESLLSQADEKLSAGGLSPMTAFVSSLVILLREGLEALLVLAAIIAFVLKTGRRDALPYVHAGWLSAVGVGIATWAIARYLIAMSGADRELSEGVTALIAAAMLLYVGYWLHSKSYAHAWQSFIRNQVSSALNKRTLWAMAGVSFLAVYRELFEIILFYEALWVQSGPQGHRSVVIGVITAVALLALLGWLILRYSVRLPIGPFFAVTSALLALLAVVFAGNGVAALQEAGVLDATSVRFISLPLLGIHPTLQGLTAQCVALALVIAGMALARRNAARARAA